MITEEMDKSLVLLANATCWPLSAMASLSHNQRSKSRKNILTSNNKDILKRWLAPDYMLYDYFKEKFERKVYEVNDWMAFQLETLKMLREQIYLDCSLDATTQENTSPVTSNNSKINKVQCKYYKIREKAFIQLIRDHQNIEKRNST